MTRRNTNAQTEHSRRLRAETANARIERLKTEGWERKTVLLSPEAMAVIEREKARYGGISNVIIEALMRLAGRSPNPTDKSCDDNRDGGS
jgi:hypothetical protein